MKPVLGEKEKREYLDLINSKDYKEVERERIQVDKFISSLRQRAEAIARSLSLNSNAVEAFGHAMEASKSRG